MLFASPTPITEVRQRVSASPAGTELVTVWELTSEAPTVANCGSSPRTAIRIDFQTTKTTVMKKPEKQHERLFRIAEELDEIAQEINDNHDRKIIKGASRDVESMGRVRRDVMALVH